MKKRVFALAAALLTAGSMSATAQQSETCGGNYTVQRGDSLSLIADRLYQDAGKWTVIYRNNTAVISSPDSIRVGQTYRMPCVDGLPRGLSGGTPLAATDSGVVATPAVVRPVSATQTRAERLEASARLQEGVDVRLLAGDDYRPFTNRLLINSGLISDLVNRAMVAQDQTGLHKFYWVNDRRVHLEPMLSEGMVDLAFPWKKPDCSENAARAACTDYVYSDILFETLIVLFTAKGRPVRFNTAADLDGVRICVPSGFEAQSLDAGGTKWLVNARVMLTQPNSVEECFNRLVSGTTDAVALNEFTGRVVIDDMRLNDEVEVMLSRPLSIEGLHVVAHRSNPRAEEMIAAFNSGLASMRESGEYVKTLDMHMSSIWAGL